MAISDFVSSLQDNQFFGAGVGVVGFGAVIAVLGKLSKRSTVLFRRYCLMSMEVTNLDKSYDWVLRWLMVHGSHTQHIAVQTSMQETQTGTFKTSFDMVPSPGLHYFWYSYKGRRRLIWYERGREMKFNAPFESVVLNTIGRDMRMFEQVLSEARELALRDIEGKTPVYKVFGSEWRLFGHPKKKRTMDSIILDRGVAESILTDINSFVSNRKWYSDRGIPYRRGYLLHGPPGCGKSSFITALAGSLDFAICVLSLTDVGLSDDRLQYLLEIAPQNALILLEDIDAAAAGRDLEKEDKARYSGMQPLTSSGLLNALDGVASSDARVVFMTTNHIERLNSAVIRPGRVDFKQEISYASAYQMSRMFCRFYGHSLWKEAENFASSAQTLKANISTAQLQAYFLFHRDNPKAARDNVARLVDMTQ